MIFNARYLIVIVALSFSAAAGSEGLLTSSRWPSHAKGLRFALPMDTGDPVLLVQCAEVQRGRGRVGVFKVAVLPQISIRDLELQVLSAPGEGGWAKLFSSFLANEPPSASIAVEGFVLKDATGSLCLSARAARVADRGRVILLDAVTIFEGPGAGSFGRGKLFLAGSRAGLLEIPGRFDNYNPIRD